MGHVKRLLDERRRRQQRRREIGQKINEYVVTLLAPQTLSDVHELVDGGKPIVAIKRVREVTGWWLGLREAKELVDALGRPSAGG